MRNRNCILSFLEIPMSITIFTRFVDLMVAALMWSGLNAAGGFADEYPSVVTTVTELLCR